MRCVRHSYIVWQNAARMQRFGNGSLDVGADTADCSLSNPQGMATVFQFHTVATAKAPGDPVVSGAHDSLCGFLFPGYINDCLLGLHARSLMKDVPRQPEDRVLWKLFGCVFRRDSECCLWNANAAFPYEDDWLRISGNYHKCTGRALSRGKVM
jgi:hypothetical protein